MKSHDVLQVITDLSDQASNNFFALEKKLEDMHREKMGLYAQIAINYERIATIILLESPNLSEVAEIQSHISQLQKEIQSAQEKLQHCENDYQKQQIEQNRLREVIITLEEKREQMLQEDKAAQAALTVLTGLSKQYEQANHLHRELSQEVESKLSEFAQSSHFVFLLKKQYGQPEYKANFLTTRFDSWLAELTQFSQNYKNYQMLTLLINESTNRLDKMRDELNLMNKHYQTFVDAAENVLGLPQYRKQFDEIEKQLAISLQQISNHQNILEQYAQGKSDNFEKIVSSMKTSLEKLSPTVLENLVKKTASSKDDMLLSEIQHIQNKILVLKKQISELQAEEEKAHIRFRRMAGLFSLFMRKGYIADNIYYNLDHNRHNPQNLFLAYIEGETTLEKIQEVFNVAKRYISPSSSSSSSTRTFSFSSSSSSSFSSSGSTGGSSFSSSSSSGGGRFRTTDSF